MGAFGRNKACRTGSRKPRGVRPCPVPGQSRGGPCGPGGSRRWLPQKPEPLGHPPCTQEAIWGVGQQGRASRAAAEQHGSSTHVPKCWLWRKVTGGGRRLPTQSADAPGSAPEPLEAWNWQLAFKTQRTSHQNMPFWLLQKPWRLAALGLFCCEAVVSLSWAAAAPQTQQGSPAPRPVSGAEPACVMQTSERPAAGLPGRGFPRPWPPVHSARCRPLGEEEGAGARGRAGTVAWPHRAQADCRTEQWICHNGNKEEGQGPVHGQPPAPAHPLPSPFACPKLCSSPPCFSDPLGGGRLT